MTDPTRLRDLLEQVAPDAPDLSVQERAAQVARRGRSSVRRDRTLVAVAALAVVMAAVTVPVLRGGDPEPAPADPPGVTVAACPDAPRDSTRSTSAALDSDWVVAAVRVCPAGEGGTTDQPSAPLIGQFAAAFMRDVRAAESGRPDRCQTILTPPWILQVQDDSGQVQRLYVSDSCEPVTLVRARPIWGSDLRAVFDGNLERQRTGVPDLACPPAASLSEMGDTWHGSFDPTAATAGIVCQQSFEEDRWGAPVEGRLDPAQLATVRSALAMPPREHRGFALDCGRALQQRLVVLADADGDQAAWRGGCSGGPVLVSIRGEWDLGSPAQHALRDALVDAGLS